MNVIIRLQNLPWSANALDIRQFFKGLSIPDGGVHIVGGEMGDAFIAFSTDEDARQAMMHDREAINGVQVRLLLSSRAEMQKVIETARQQSLRALQNSTSVASPKVTPPSMPQKVGAVTKPQPPVITANSLQCILSNSMTAMTPSFLAYQKQAGISLISTSINNNKLDDADDMVSQNHLDQRSISRERGAGSRSRSRSKERSSFVRRRRDRSREQSRGREKNIGVRRRSRNSRDRSHERSRSRSSSRDRSRDRAYNRDRGHERFRNPQQSTIRNIKAGGFCDTDTNNTKSQKISAWGGALANSVYNTSIEGYSNNRNSDVVNETSEKSSKSLTSINNYSLSSFLNRSNSNKGLAYTALQNPYTAALNPDSPSKPANKLTTSSSAIPGIFVEKKSDDIGISSGETPLPQEGIVFADTNPYEKMYPNLFAQAAAIGTVGQKSVQSRNNQSSPVSPKEEDINIRENDPLKTRCIKILNMCPGTTYSDIRKFCVGLYIPHNGIKMVNDIHGLRVGIAYVQFSKYTCVARALARSNRQLRNRTITIEAVSEEEFESITDSFHPDNHDRIGSGNRGDYHSETFDGPNTSTNHYKGQSSNEPFCVLYIEDIPSLTTEQDIMKMFSSYSLYDILLLASPENRREFVAHVRFSREEDAMSAFEDKAHHQIGYRRLRVWPGSMEEMDRAKEKIRIANEQLMKEEKAAAEEDERRRKKEEAAAVNKQKEIISLDLTQSDCEDDDNADRDVDSHDFIHNTNKLIDEVVNNGDGDVDDDGKYYDRYDSYNSRQNENDDDGDLDNCNNAIPSHFEFESMNTNPTTTRVKDPRLRKSQRGVTSDKGQNAPMANSGGTSNFNNFNPNFNDQPILTSPVNNIEQNFVILKNCDYSTRINDVAQLLVTANLALKHIEPLNNERQLPTGEFIVEFRRTQDAEIAVNRFHNIQFMNRSLRVFPITPQEIANRLGKPFLSYIPGGNGIKISDLKTLAAAMNVGNIGSGDIGGMNPRMDWNGGNNNNFNTRCGGGSINRFETNDASYSNIRNCNMDEDNDNNDLPERFNRPGCVLELENVPYKAQLSDILNFFHGFDLKSEDIIRRFNDNGQPTGDARVAFDSPEAARKAFDARKRKQIFNRTIYLNIL